MRLLKFTADGPPPPLPRIVSLCGYMMHTSCIALAPIELWITLLNYCYDMFEPGAVQDGGWPIAVIDCYKRARGGGKVTMIPKLKLSQKYMRSLMARHINEPGTSEISFTVTVYGGSLRVVVRNLALKQFWSTERNRFSRITRVRSGTTKKHLACWHLGLRWCSTVKFESSVIL